MLTALLAVPAPHVAMIFLGIVLVAALAMTGLARLGLKGAGRLAQHTTGMWRLALGQLRRAERMAVASVVALAAGTAVLTAVLLVENGLSRELRENRPMNEEAPAAVRTALEMGYRLIDTAAKYENEEAVGQGIAQAGDGPRGEGRGEAAVADGVEVFGGRGHRKS